MARHANLHPVHGDRVHCLLLASLPAASLGTALWPHPLVPHWRCRFLQGLFTLALDTSTAVRKAVCTGLVAMLMAVPERLEASMPDLIEYMLKSTQVGRLRVPGRVRVAG